MDETASNARLEAVFALRTSTAGPPVALTFSVDPEPTLMVGAPELLTRKPVPPVVLIVKLVKLNVPAAAPVSATPPAPPLRFTLVTSEPPVFVPAMAAPPLPAMSTPSTRLPEARATVPESDGRFAGVPVASVSAPTTRFTGSPSSFWLARSENPPVRPVVVPSPL